MKNDLLRTTPLTFKAQLLLFGLLFILMASKSPDSLTHAQFWAEDGSLFFQQQYGSHIPLLDVTYAGYIHVIPRLVAWLATFFSYREAPFVYNLLACLLAAWSISYIIQRVRDIIPLMLSLAIFLLVPINGEIFGAIANVQWFSQFALMALCLPTDRDSRDRFPFYALIVIVALTGPGSVFVASINLAVLGFTKILVRIRPSSSLAINLSDYSNRLPRVRITITVLCAAIQLACVVMHAASVAHRATHPDHHFGTELVVATLGKMLPVHVFGFYTLNATIWILIEICIFGALFFGKTIPFSSKLIVGKLLVFSLCLIFSAVVLKDAGAMTSLIGGDRYFYAFKFTFWWSLYLAFKSQFENYRDEALCVALVSIAYIGILNAKFLQRPTLPDLDWRNQAKTLNAGGYHEIPINPMPWKVSVRTVPHDNPESN